MKDMRAVRFNEKVKRASTLFGNGGVALLIAGLSRWYGASFDLITALWLLLALMLIYVSVQLNAVLLMEDEA